MSSQGPKRGKPFWSLPEETVASRGRGGQSWQRYSPPFPQTPPAQEAHPLTPLCPKPIFPTLSEVIKPQDLGAEAPRELLWVEGAFSPERKGFGGGGGGGGGLGDREAEKTGNAGTPPPCSCPLALGPRHHPPPPLPCSVCVTTPDTGLGAARPDCQWTDSEFHCLVCTALKLFSTLDREGKPPQRRK